MTDNLSSISQALFLLEGTWTGEGRGQYPGISSFDYRERLTFTRYSEKSLAYEQRAQKRDDGQTEFLVSHGENGFIRVLETGELEMINAQSGGRSEVLTGIVEELNSAIRIHFTSKSVMNDPRMIASTRTLQLEGDTLRYEMKMHTTKVDGLTSHLDIVLQRFK